MYGNLCLLNVIYLKTEMIQQTLYNLKLLQFQNIFYTIYKQ